MSVRDTTGRSRAGSQRLGMGADASHASVRRPCLVAWQRKRRAYGQLERIECGPNEIVLHVRAGADALRFAFSCDTAMVREGSVLLREALS